MIQNPVSHGCHLPVGVCMQVCGTWRVSAKLIRREGEWSGKQILPASVIDDIRRGGDLAKFTYEGIPGYSYRSMWWVPHDEFGAIEAQGIHGQGLYIAPGAEMVIVLFASHPLHLCI